MKGEAARNKIKGRVGPALYSVMEPGDDIVAGMMTEAGPRPGLDMLAALVAIGIGMGGWFDLFGPGLSPSARAVLGIVSFAAGPWPVITLVVRKPVFVAVTQRELMCYRMSRFDHAPVRLLFRAPPACVRITGSGRRGLWSSVRYSGPGARNRGLRLNIVWYWRQDLHEVLTALLLAGAAVDISAGVTAPPLVPTSIGVKS